MKPNFFISLAKEIRDDDLMGLANALTYKLVLAVFPLIIFTMTILGFLNIDSSGFLDTVSETLPPQITNIINIFISEVFNERSLSLMSASLFVTVFSASSGFRAIVKGINKSYGIRDARNALHIGIISVGLVFLFTTVIAASLVVLIFGRNILSLIERYYGASQYLHYGFSALRGFGVIMAMLIAVCVIYKLSCCKKVRFISVLPGACFTVALWVLASKAFEIYVTNFARFSIVYGSLGSIFILMIWLNIMALVLLVGSEVNALLSVED